MASNLFDKMAVLQVLGCIMLQPTLLDTYSLIPEDFNGEDFHQIVFASIFNLYNKGAEVIDCFAIDSFISGYAKQYQIFNDNDGLNYLNDAMNLCEPANFEYNYNRIKKFSLLRYYESQKYDISLIYNTSIVDPIEQEKEQTKFDNYSIEDIIGIVEYKMVIEPKSKYRSPTKIKGQLIGVGMLDLIEAFRKAPEVGYPMQSKIMNNLLRGARRKTFYLRSGGTGSGKSRLSFADTCCASIPWLYNLERKEWEHTGFSSPALIISTELSIEEVQSIVLAFVSGVEEDHIIDNSYKGDELERVIQAAQYIESSPLYIEYLPNFDLDDVGNLIKKYYFEKQVELVNFDYLHTSIKMMIQISNLSRGMRMREDQVLFMASDALKTCSTEMDIHIDSATQLNGEYKDAKEKDQNILRGSKAIADRIDAGYIAIAPTRMELEAVKPILSHGLYPEPNMIYHLYKCRRGKITRVKVWLHANLGNCRVRDLFVTTFDNELIPVDKLTIESAEKIIKDHSVDEKEIVATAEEQVEAAKTFLSF